MAEGFEQAGGPFDRADAVGVRGFAVPAAVIRYPIRSRPGSAPTSVRYGRSGGGAE